MRSTATSAFTYDKNINRKQTAHIFCNYTAVNTKNISDDANILFVAHNNNNNDNQKKDELFSFIFISWCTCDRKCWMNGKTANNVTLNLLGTFLLATYGILGKYWFTVENTEKNILLIFIL
jgi:hypothetical protein